MMKIKAFYSSFIYFGAASSFSATLQHTRRPHSSYPLLYATYNPSSTYLHEISSTHINSAIDILEEQHYNKQDVPIDSILRKYIKQYSYELNYDSDEKELIRDLILGCKISI